MRHSTRAVRVAGFALLALLGQGCAEKDGDLGSDEQAMVEMTSQETITETAGETLTAVGGGAAGGGGTGGNAGGGGEPTCSEADVEMLNLPAAEDIAQADFWADENVLRRDYDMENGSSYSIYNEELDEEDLPHTKSIFAPCPPGPVGCAVAPAAANATCESLWGPSSGKSYRIPCACGAGGTCTNSDCFSNCMNNMCTCGAASGKAQGCPAGAVKPPPAPGATCSCARSGVHNYWCCTPGQTYDGWSCTDYCPPLPVPPTPVVKCGGKVCGIPLSVPCCTSP